jgi:hypothetical protein
VASVADTDVHVEFELSPAPVPVEPLVAFVDYNEAGLVGASPPVLANFLILIDLSDTVNYRHNLTGALEIFQIAAIMQKSAAAASWEQFVGVVLAVTGVNVTVAYLEAGTIVEPGILARVEEDRVFVPSLDLRVTSGALARGVVFSLVTETAINSASTIRTSRPGAPTATPQVGDLILRVQKLSGGGTLRAREFVHYRGVE